MITAEEARLKTHASFLESDLATIETQISDEIRRKKIACGISVHPEYSGLFNAKEACIKMKDYGYRVFYTDSDKGIYYIIIWNYDLFLTLANKSNKYTEL